MILGLNRALDLKKQTELTNLYLPHKGNWSDMKCKRSVRIIRLLYSAFIIILHLVIFVGTVADNIRYGPQLRGKKLSDDEITKLLALADLDSSFASKSGSELSAGQAQRVALARTLANDPEVHTELHQSNFTFVHISF